MVVPFRSLKLKGNTGSLKRQEQQAEFGWFEDLHIFYVLSRLRNLLQASNKL